MKNKWNKWLVDLDGVVDVCTSAMSEVWPEYKGGESYENIARKWFTQMPFHAYAKSHFDHSTGYQVALKDLRSAFNYRYNRKHYWFDWFCTNYPIWSILQKGNEFKGNTRVAIHPTEEQLLSIATPEEIGQVYLSELDKDHPENQIDYIDIDLDNLRRFIKVSEHNVIAKARVGKTYVDKIAKNIIQAKKIVLLAEYFDDTVVNPLTGDVRYRIPQPYKISPFGRRYYIGGFALQNKSSDVRTAALGRCYSIDIDSSVFRFYKMLAHDFGIEHRTLDILLSDKVAFRSELAMCLENISTDTAYLIKLIKRSITALGFGARDTSYWDPDKERMSGALHEIIKNKDDRERLTSHPYWQDLKRIYNEIKTVIQKDKKLVDAYKKDPVYWQRNKYTADRLMSLLYQQYEANVMERVIELLNDCEREPRLWVHDGVYTLLKPMGNMGYMAAIKQIIQEEINPFIEFEITEHQEYVVQFTEEIRAEETEHKRNIGVEEMLARQWAYDAQFTKELTPEERLAGLRLRNPEFVDNSTGDDGEMPDGYYDGNPKYDTEWLDEYYESIDWQTDTHATHFSKKTPKPANIMSTKQVLNETTYCAKKPV